MSEPAVPQEAQSEDEAPKNEASAKKTPPKKTRPLVRAGQALAGLALGLAIAEGAFWLRDGGAFPHLNVYTADPELGLRLEKGSSESISFGGNPITSVRINSSGFRGEDWPAQGGNEIIVVGDSQAFGLGVNEGDTFSKTLETTLGGDTRVLNAGVPTWGPVEYNRILKELVPARKPKAIVYTVNFVNDAFEAERPNPERHALWDGWAVRKETAPTSITNFPGRHFLFGKSHAFFALRSFLHGAQGPERDDRGFASEGTWKDLIGMGGERATQNDFARDEIERMGQLQESRARFAARKALAAELRVKLLAYNILKLDGQTASVYSSSHANPGDIVTPQWGEEGMPLGASVLYIQQAADMRRRFEAELKKRAAENAGSDEAKQIESALSERDELEKKLIEVLSEPVALARASYPLLKAVLEAKSFVESMGVRFVLLALPIDVYVSADEWKKYGREPMDISGLQVLINDLAEGTRELGASAVDATQALKEAEPGAFLLGDPHMSAKGHAAVAKALKQALDEPPPRAKPEPRVKLPQGRSRLPHSEDWNSQSGDVLVSGSDAAGCRTLRIREYLLVRCSQKEKLGPVPRGARIDKGGHGEAMIWTWNNTVTLVAPTVKGDDFQATLFWNKQAKRLTVQWPENEIVPTVSKLGDAEGSLENTAPGSAEQTICGCITKVNPKATCELWAGSADADCIRTYSDDCERLLECASGRAYRPPKCEAGFVNAGAAMHCHALPDEKGQCPAGTALVEKQGAKLCADKAAAEGSANMSYEGDVPGFVRVEKPARMPSEENIKQFDEIAMKTLGAVDTALKGCKLEFTEPGFWFDFEFFDWCTWKEGVVPSVSKSAGELSALLKTAPELREDKRKDFIAKLDMFHDWLLLAERSKESRGTLALFQELALAWNAYQSDKNKHVAPDPAHIVHQYTVDFGNAHVNYLSESNRAWEKRKALGSPLPWRRGLHGPRLPNF